jgi:predicted TIM-barrel fold metal-dependent hydrolase
MLKGMAMPDYSLDWMISVDDHVLEPKHLWQDRVPAKYRDAAPRMITEDGMDYWQYDGHRIATAGLAASAGKSRQEFSYEPVTYSDMRPGCYDSRERLNDMNVAGVLASMCFPSFPRFCGQVFYEAADRDLALVCVRAYNDWMIEEWCGVAPGRFIPLLIIPLWDPKLAAEEVRRGAERGARAIAFSENPEPLGLPTINDPGRYWDPVWEACHETGTVVCMHIGSSSVPMRFSSDSYTVMNLAWGAGSRVSGTMLDWLFSPVFDRFPSLKIALSEGGIGWMPYFLERAEQVIDKQRYWASKGEQIYNAQTAQTQIDASRAIDLESFDLRQRFRDHVFGCFIDDTVGLKHIRELGIENVMIESDYPHSDSTWPDSLPHARRQLAKTDLSDQEKWLVLRGNAERVFQFSPAAPPDVPSRTGTVGAGSGALPSG